MSEFEQWVLNGLALNDTTFTMEQLSAPVPTKIAEWVRGADSEGAILARVPKHENRVIEMTLRVKKQASMDAALAKLALIIDELQECAMNENGVGLIWTPADSSSVGPITFRCLMGEIVDLPIDWQDSGWLVYTPLIRIRLTCLPFGHGAEVSKGTVTSSDPLVTLEITGVAGDVPALGRLVVTDAASQSRRWIVWGLESRYYPRSSPQSLIVDSASMVTTGFAGATATRSGAYSGASNNVIRATMNTRLQVVCGLGVLLHAGQFRPHLRFYASAETVALRLIYQAGGGPFLPLGFQWAVGVGWNCIDLGLVTLPESVLGTEQWTGRIEAYSTATGGETLDVDVMSMLPAEAFGRARSPYAHGAGLLLAHDAFTGGTAGAALAGRVAPLGGTWTTSGATGDFIAADGPAAAEESFKRATTSDVGGRIAQLGATAYGDVEIGVDVQFTTPVSGSLQATVARVTDALNYVQCSLVYVQGRYVLKLDLIVAGSVVKTVERFVTLQAGVWYGLRLVAYAGSGTAHGGLTSGMANLAAADIAHTALATGGAAASGVPQFFDVNATASATTRYYDNYYHATPDTEPAVINAGQSIEVRHDSALREDPGGTYAGAPPEYVGSRFTVPCAGGTTRKARVAVMARRNDLATLTDDNIADSTTVAVYVTPRYLAIPR